MMLKEKLQSIVDHYVAEIEHIRIFVSSVEKTLDKNQKRKTIKAFTENDKLQLSKLIRQFNSLLTGSGSTELEISDSVAKFVLHVFSMIKQKSLLSEMSLAYLVSYQEAFVKDYVYEILTTKKEILRSNATLTYEQLLKFSSIDAIVSEMAKREVDSLGYCSIDDVASYFDKKIGISLTKYPKWQHLREIHYRRNIIIHNRGKTNRIYCTKTGVAECGKRLATDNDYVSSAIEITIKFIYFLNAEIVSHF